MRNWAAHSLSRLLLACGPLVRRLHLMRAWSIVIRLLRRRGVPYINSVYGPALKADWDDHQFVLCVTGKSGFKLSDLLHAKREPFVFVDIGANMGVYCLVADTNPNCSTAYGLEPNPKVFEVFGENVRANDAKKVRPLNVGIAEQNGKKQLFFKDWHRGLGNFLDKGDYVVDVDIRDHTLFDEIARNHPNERFFIKIDVEGFEPEVVRQFAQSKLCQSVDDLFIEISPQWISGQEITEIFEALRLAGLREAWRSTGVDQYDVHFVRPDPYKLVEAHNGKQETAAPKVDRPQFSICVCNYNMADTLERAMSSVIEQLDERFEVLVIDDGSSDGSIEVLERLAARFDRFRFIPLPRDLNRQLGETRNISIRAARGEYVLLHIDADDVWQPFLPELMTLFLNLEKAVGHDFLLVGSQTGIAKRDFLLRLGPYENIYRCEDRNMMFNLAADERILFMDYKTFRTRLERPRKVQFFKTIKDVWSHTVYDMRLEANPHGQYVLDALTGPFRKSQFGLRLTLLRALLIVPAYLYARTQRSISLPMSWDDFMAYRQAHRGTYQELMEQYGSSTDISFLSEGASKIFTYNVKNAGFSGV